MDNAQAYAVMAIIGLRTEVDGILVVLNKMMGKMRKDLAAALIRNGRRVSCRELINL